MSTNNLNFIIHVTTCNPFVFMGWEEYNQILGSTMTLNYIPAANLPSVRKNLLFNPPPHQHHLSLFLSRYKMTLLLCPRHIQREDEYLT